MEATVVSVGKAVLSGAVDYAKSAAAEELALQLGVERDVSFIADELEMMQSFLMTADEERDQNNKVLNTWVKQVGNVAYNVEDSLVDFEIHVEREKPPFLGCIPRNLCDRRRISMEVKELKAKVEDVSSRNMRYRLIKQDGTRGSKSVVSGVERDGIAGAGMMFGIDEAWHATMEQEKPKVDLGDLIISEVVDLQVMAVWGKSGNLGKMSVICKVFDDSNVKAKFGCRAWVRLMHPFDPKEFLQSLVRQFYVNSSKEQENSAHQEGTIIVGADVLLKMEKMEQSDFIREFKAKVSSNSYLIVINDLATIEEWHCIKTYFPDKKNGSRIVVATQQMELASLCPEQPYQASKLEQMSSDQVLYLFHKKVEEPISKTASVTTTRTSSSTTTPSEIQEEGVQQQHSAGVENVVSTTLTIGRKFYRSKTVIPGDDVVGRSTEKQKIIDLLGQPTDSHNFKVISVWGMGGIGKTTLVRSVYQSQQLSGWKRAWVTVLHPFNCDMLLRHLALQLLDPTIVGEDNIITMESSKLDAKLSRFLVNQNCLIVLDDLSSIEEWNSMKPILTKTKRIIATTREKFVAKHCSSEDELNMHSLRGLEESTALELFKKKVFKDASNFDLDPVRLDLAKLILKKCNGLPLAVATVGGYLSNRPQNAMEWRKLNNSLSAEIEINPELNTINTALMRSYDGLPYHLKSSFLYLSIFPEDHLISRKRVVRRWIAEGYSREMHHMTAEQVGDKHFDDLLDRSMTLHLEGGPYGTIKSCQLHDLIREICMSKAREENLAFTLEEGCNLSSTQRAIRHLSINRNWKRDKDVMQSMLDLSHVRSLTVFGEWRSFFISDKIRFLRVLDLEHTVGLRDHHLHQIMELLHLRYLSLRGCINIFKLPDSLANLRQLMTLDVRGTSIWTLPTTVSYLRKLQYLLASPEVVLGNEQDMLRTFHHIYDSTWTRGAVKEPLCCRIIDNCTCFNHFQDMGYLLWRPRLIDGLFGRYGIPAAEGMSRRDICNMYHNYWTRVKKDGLFNRGIVVPRGISKLKALQTLRGVKVAWGEAMFQELKELTQLRKLGVIGVSNKNREKFWRAIAGHSSLHSLSVQRDRNIIDDNYNIDADLGESLWPPKCLESLKIEGILVKLTEWIHRLQNLSKLQLACTRVNQDAIHATGMLPNLAILRLKFDSFDGDRLRLQRSSFPSLLVLELHELIDLSSVEFEQDAMPKLELLIIAYNSRRVDFSGLQYLSSLKEIRVDDDLKELVQRKLAEYPNNITLKLK